MDTLTKGGLQIEASISGVKYTYRDLGEPDS